MSCVYFLIKGVEIVYVGQTIDLDRRLKQHRDKEYDHVRHIECFIESLKKYEDRLIKLFNPKYNKPLGRRPWKEEKFVGFNMKINSDFLEKAQRHVYTTREDGGLSGLIRRLLAKEIGYRDKE